MSASIDTPSYAQVERLHTELHATRQELRTVSAGLKELGASVERLPRAFEDARSDRHTKLMTSLLMGAGVVGLTVLVSIVGVWNGGGIG